MLRFCIAPALLCVTSFAQAAYAFSNFGPGHTHRFPDGETLSSDFSNRTLGFRFTSTLSGSLTGFDVAIYPDFFPSTTGSVPYVLILTRANADGTSGDFLGAWGAQSGNYSFPGGVITPTNVSTVTASGVELVAGSSYYLIAGSQGAKINWFHALAPARTDVLFPSGDVGTTDTPGAFSVNVEPVQAVPEPMTVGLLGAGVAATLRRRKARKASTIPAG